MGERKLSNQMSQQMPRVRFRQKVMMRILFENQKIKKEGEKRRIWLTERRRKAKIRRKRTRMIIIRELANQMSQQMSRVRFRQKVMMRILFENQKIKKEGEKRRIWLT